MDAIVRAAYQVVQDLSNQGVEFHVPEDLERLDRVV